MVASWVLEPWFQVILFIVTFFAFVGLFEFYRWFPLINLYLSIISIIIFFPMQIGVIPGINAGGIGTTLKFLGIVPFLVMTCAWRLSYMPINEDNKFETITIKFCKKLFFCRKNADSKRPTGIMEIIWFLVPFGNILAPSILGFFWGSITNNIAGILMAFSFPIPQRVVKLNYYHMIFVSNKYNNNRVYDISVDGIGFFWITCFTSWELLFTFAHVTEDWLLHSFHFIPLFFRCIVTGQYDLWGELRVFGFGVALCMYAPMRATVDPILDWYLNTKNVPVIMEASTKQWIIELWGTINIILILIHCVLYIKELYKRKDIPEDKVDQPLIVDVVQQNTFVTNSIEYDANKTDQPLKDDYL
eukprot:118340_1